MRYSVIFIIVIFAAFVSNAVFAENSVPFAGELRSKIINYNRATPNLATSGRLGEGALEELKEHGIKTIIDLRTAKEGTAEEKAEAEKLGLTYINIPVTGAGIDEKQLLEFSRIFQTAQKPILMHCGSGNRVGAMLSSYYLSQGMGKEHALEIGRTAGMRPNLEEKVLSNCKTCK